MPGSPHRDLASRQHHHEAIDALALLEMGLDDLIDVLRRGWTIPRRHRIDHHQRTGGAEAETADAVKPISSAAAPRSPCRTAPTKPHRRPRRSCRGMARRTLGMAGKDVMPVELRELELLLVHTVTHTAATAIPLSFNSAASSPALNISRTMSQPPRNSPLT